MSIHRTGRPIVLVTGATGAQGGSVARALLADGRWSVRALTRRPDAPAARALRAAGAEIVAGDLASRATVRAAVDGAEAVFGVTSFWEHFAGEYEHGRHLVEAVAAADVRHFVFSTLPSAPRLTGGELHVPHFDLKARLEDETRALDIPATFLHVAFYYENFLAFFPPRPAGDGRWVIAVPQGDTPLAAVSVDDVGGLVAPILARRDEFLGRTVVAAGDELPMTGYAAAMTRATGHRIEFAHVPREEYAALGFPGAEELADMFDMYRRFFPSRAAEIAANRTLYPGLRDFAAWLRTHAGALVRAVAA